MRGRTGIAFLALAMLLGACVPGYQVTDGGEPVSRSGRLDGEMHDGVECAWITDAVGKRTQLLWFYDGAVRFKPFRFVDGAGLVIAQAGDVVTVTGPSSSIAETICAAPGDDAFGFSLMTGPGGTLSFPSDPPL
jgi:hypothetical protein